jgi:hypothetical protein
MPHQKPLALLSIDFLRLNYQQSISVIDGHKVGARGDEGAAASVGLERTSIIVFESC